MFTTVKNLTALIDKEIGYLSEAYETRENHDKEVFEKYVDDMSKSLRSKFKKLCEISSNKRLIEAYRARINAVTR